MVLSFGFRVVYCISGFVGGRVVVGDWMKAGVGFV